MVQGSFYHQQRRCGKANCRCAQGQLHSAWVITRSLGGKSHTYMVPVEDRARLRQLPADVSGLNIDQMAEKRLINWPEKKLKSLG